jgi:hypothetical protein
MKSGIEVLDDLISFFESSAAFISVACEKMRRTHGPSFKMATVKAILGLRTDLTKEDRALALKVCEEILEEFKKNPQYDQLKKKGGGVFQNLDTSQAEKAADLDNEDEDEPEFDMNDFLKQGGVIIDEDQSPEEKGTSPSDP